MTAIEYMDLYEIIQNEDDIDLLRYKTVYLLVCLMTVDENLSEEEVEAFVQFAGIDMGLIEETIH